MPVLTGKLLAGKAFIELALACIDHTGLSKVWLCSQGPVLLVRTVAAFMSTWRGGLPALAGSLTCTLQVCFCHLQVDCKDIVTAVVEPLLSFVLLTGIQLTPQLCLSCVWTGYIYLSALRLHDSTTLLRKRVGSVRSALVAVDVAALVEPVSSKCAIWLLQPTLRIGTCERQFLPILLCSLVSY